MKKICAYIPTTLTILLIAILGVTTFIEAKLGTDFVMNKIYSSIFFIIFLSIIFLSYMVYFIFNRNFKKKLTNFLILISSGIILLGGLLTFLTAETTDISLTKGEFYTKNDISLPFKIKLTDFKVNYYAGTNSPMDYVSEVEIIDNQNIIKKIISMNNILKYKGYKFYQADYSEDLQSSTLMVVQDKLGSLTTYIGYILLCLSMFLGLFNKSGKYRKIIKNAVCTVIVFLATSSTIAAQKTISKDEAKILGELAVYYNGRIAPLDSYSKDFVKKIYGDNKYGEFSSMQVMAGFLFYPEEWQYVNLVKIKKAEVRNLLKCEKYINFSQLARVKNEGELLSSHKFGNRAIRELDEKFNLISQMFYGENLKIFPENNKWYCANDDLTSLDSNDRLLVTGIWQILQESVEQGENDFTANIITKLKEYQIKRVTENSISVNKIKAEITLNSINPIKILFMLNLTLAIFAFIVLIMSIFKKKKIRCLRFSIFILTILSFISLLIVIGLRWYISGHIPLAGMYDTVLFVAFVLQIMTIILYKKSEILPFIGLLLTGLILLVLNISGINPKITPLMPVLNTPWLLFHVATVMLSYSLFALSFILAIIFFIGIFFDKQRIFTDKITNLSKLFMYPATILLAIGIMIGAIWANISWGRYWAWDPKEVWALITLLCYMCCININFKKEGFYHIASILCFCSIIMTYFGVSYFLSGMHAY